MCEHIYVLDIEGYSNLFDFHRNMVKMHKEHRNQILEDLPRMLDMAKRCRNYPKLRSSALKRYFELRRELIRVESYLKLSHGTHVKTYV